ncbi:MAG TPA: hypothetical protein VF834_13820 [Streptosporangiaceae bacterium]
MTGEFRDCPSCGPQREFIQHHPYDCPDSADGWCPEWFCVSCGLALLTGFATVGADLDAAATLPAARQLNRVA